jgi:hypothetical protein
MMFTLGSSWLGSRKLEKQSDSWKKLRRVVMERARHTTLEPLEHVHVVFLGASALYLTGLVQFAILGQAIEFTWFMGFFIVAVAVSGILIPILFGAILAIRHIDQKLAVLDCR